MDCEHKLKVLEQEIESLKEENRLLKEKLSSSEKNFDGVSFKEKYAVRILDSLPDMLTVFNHEEMGIEVVSNEETNHVGVSNNDFKGMRMQDMVPKEAYHNIHNNLQKVISTGRGSTAHHELDVDGTLHYYENRIFPLDEEYVLIMCRDISERVATQQNLEIFKRILDRVSDSILAVSADGTLVYANRQFCGGRHPALALHRDLCARLLDRGGKGLSRAHPRRARAGDPQLLGLRRRGARVDRPGGRERRRRTQGDGRAPDAHGTPSQRRGRGGGRRDALLRRDSSRNGRARSRLSGKREIGARNPSDREEGGGRSLPLFARPLLCRVV